MSEEGVDLSRVVLGHSGDADRRRLPQRMAETGLILGMDRFGIDHFAIQQRGRPWRDVPPRLCRQHGAVARPALLPRLVDPSALAKLQEWHYLHLNRT